MKTPLKKDEEVVLLLHPHWFTLAWPALITVASIAGGFILGGYGLVLPLLFSLYFAYKVIERMNNLWAVTNLRVIDEFGVFSNNSKESPLDKINNVAYRQPLLGKILGYGSVQIQTAAEVGATVYTMVDDPRALKDTITQMQEEYKHRQIRNQAAAMASFVSGGQPGQVTNAALELEKLHELKLKGIVTEEEYIARKTKLLQS